MRLTILSKKESKFRQKIFAEYHLDKLAQIAFDKRIRELKTTYKLQYFYMKENIYYGGLRYSGIFSIVSSNGIRRVSKGLGNLNTTLGKSAINFDTTAEYFERLSDAWNAIPLENYVRIDNI